MVAFILRHPKKKEMVWVKKKKKILKKKEIQNRKIKKEGKEISKFIYYLFEGFLGYKIKKNEVNSKLKIEKKQRIEI
jgi:hypothetical protein